MSAYIDMCFHGLIFVLASGTVGKTTAEVGYCLIIEICLKGKKRYVGLILKMQRHLKWWSIADNYNLKLLIIMGHIK